MEFDFEGSAPGAAEPRPGPITLGGLAGLLDAIPAAGGRPPVSALPELAARLIAGCTGLSVERARAMGARAAVDLVEECLARNDIAELVACSRRVVRLASDAVARAAERSEQ